MDLLASGATMSRFYNTPTPATLGQRIAEARRHKQMTQQQLATRILNKDGTPKSRATIVQYEKDNIQPPIDVIKAIAEVLGESPSYLAYGGCVVKGLSTDALDMVLIPVKHVGRDGSHGTSVYGLHEAMVEQLGLDRDSIAVYWMDHAAPAFGLSEGDHLIVDSRVTTPSHKGGKHLVRTTSGMEVVNVEQHYGSGARGKTLRFENREGRSISAKISDLTFLGAVVLAEMKLN